MTSQKSTKFTKRPLCAGCGDNITDPYIMKVAPDLNWHASCLKCSECHSKLDETCTCFVRDDRTFCKTDYIRLFGRRCYRCNQGFVCNEFVMRAKSRVYHVRCFRCLVCDRLLEAGDQFMLNKDGVLCKNDNEFIEASFDHGQCRDNTVVIQRSEDNPESLFKNKVNLDQDSDTEFESDGFDFTKYSNQEYRYRRVRCGPKTESKITRIRTVLNEKQLHTLRACYVANPRPDAIVKEKLVEMTGLSPRVIRVWFQNKRCKDKKRSIYLKQIHQTHNKNRNTNAPNLNGVPMVVASPVRHEPLIQQNQVEVQTIHASWKTSNEFSEQKDVRQRPFQQLIRRFVIDSNVEGNNNSAPILHYSS